MQMKKFISISIGMMLILAVTMPAVAQAPPTGQHVFHPPIRIVAFDSTTPSGIFPVQMRAAYRYNAIPNQGQNMVIGIADACDDPDIEADLGVFSTQFNLPACTTGNGCFTKITQTGLCSGHQGNWALEQSLDVEWAHAMAPRAKIVLVESSQPDDTLFMAVTQAVGAGASVVSMSWGGGEFSGEQTYDTTYFSAPGVTYFASTGDSGCGAQYPAASPNVVAVGGTHLVLLTAAPPSTPLGTNYGNETAWSGSGGGISAFEAEPAYQMNTQHTGFRTVPDVALDASPASGVPVYDSYDGFQWVRVGGTSVSSPIWAAFMAIENSLRGGAGVIQQPLPDLYQIYGSGNYAADFHDITTGSSGGVCVAGLGYDFVTGIGTPIANHLANDLIPLP
jgi:subtilase family serine protease